MPKVSSTDKIENKIFFSLYKPEKEIGEGSFGRVYSGYNIKTNEKVAFKFEPKNKSQGFLEQESCILFYLKGGEGIPTFFSYGYSDNYNILIMELLGKSLDSLFEERHMKFSIKTVCLLALQMLNRLEFIHSKHLIHRDLKPDNFAMGLDENKTTVYLIDYGLTKKYRSSKTLEHIKFCNNHKLTGTARYASANALGGYEQSRRDDLEGLCYVLLYFLKGSLPWQGLKLHRKEERYRKIREIKMKISVKDLVGIEYPYEFQEFVTYCRELGFEDDPDYSYLGDLIRKIMIKYSFEFDMVFDWNKKSIFRKRMTSSSRDRPIIYDKLNESTKTKEDDSDSVNNNNISENIDNMITKDFEFNDYKFISNINRKYKKKKEDIKIKEPVITTQRANGDFYEEDNLLNDSTCIIY